MGVGGKLNLALYLVIVLFLVLVGSLLYVESNVSRVVDLLMQGNRAQISLYQMTNATNQLMVSDKPLDQLLSVWEESIAGFDRSLEDLRAQARTRHIPEALVGELEDLQENWARSAASVASQKDALQRLADSGEIPGYQKTGLFLMERYVGSGRASSVTTAISDARTELRQFIREAESLTAQLDELNVQLDVVGERIRKLGSVAALAGSVLIVLGATVFVTIFSRAFASRVSSLEKTMQQVSERDMTVRSSVRGSDEIASLGTYLDHTLDVLGEFFGSVRAATSEADTLSDTLSAGTAETVSAVNEISTSIDSFTGQLQTVDGHLTETSKAVEEISTQAAGLKASADQQAEEISKSVRSAESMNASIERVAALARERRASSGELVETIMDGGDKIRTTHEIIEGVTREIGDILRIIEVINGVADQTSLLSMNAAIESAHAGAAGRGFAVVAEEIRKLAESSSDNAAQIDTLLKRITAEVRSAVQASNVGVHAFESVSAHLNEFQTTLEEIETNTATVEQESRTIVRAIQQIAEIATSVKDAAEALDNRTDQIDGAMERVSGLSRQVVTGMQEIDVGAKEILNNLQGVADTSEDTHRRMQVLIKMLGSFQLEAEPGEHPRA